VENLPPYDPDDMNLAGMRDRLALMAARRDTGRASYARMVNPHA